MSSYLGLYPMWSQLVTIWVLGPSTHFPAQLHTYQFFGWYSQFSSMSSARLLLLCEWTSNQTPGLNREWKQNSSNKCSTNLLLVSSTISLISKRKTKAICLSSFHGPLQLALWSTFCSAQLHFPLWRCLVSLSNEPSVKGSFQTDKRQDTKIVS